MMDNTEDVISQNGIGSRDLVVKSKKRDQSIRRYKNIGNENLERLGKKGQLRDCLRVDRFRDYGFALPGYFRFLAVMRPC